MPGVAKRLKESVALLAPSRLLRQSVLARYTAAVLITLAALWLNFSPQLRPQAFFFFYAAVALTARYCGAAPAAVSTLMSAVFADYFFLGGFQGWAYATPDLVQLFGFAVVCSIIISIAVQRSRAELAEQEKRNQMAAIVESSEDAILSKTMSGTVTSWNAGAERLYGYKPNEIIGRNVSLLMPDPQELIGIMSRLARKEAIEHYETIRKKKDGSRVQVSVSISPVLNNAGEAVGAASIARDITVQKQAEAELRMARRAAETAQRETAEILSSIAEGFIVYDLEWNVSYINEQGAALLGRSRESQIGKNIAENPRMAGSNWEKQLREAASQQHITRFDEFYEPEKKWFRVSVYPSPSRVAVFFQDVTERRRAEDELRTSEQRMQFAQTAARLGPWEWNVKTGEVWWSDGVWPLHGHAPRSFIPSYDKGIELIFPEDREKVSHAVEQALAGRGEYNVEYRVQWPDGSLHWVVARGQVICGSDGQAEKMIGVAMDVSERKMAEETLRRTEKLAAAGRLAASVAHEINNPLESVTNLIYLARRKQSDPERSRYYLTMADEELGRVAHIARQTLGFYRDTSAPAAADITELLDDVLNLYRRKLQSNDIRVKKLQSDHVKATVLAGEIRQLLSNLIVNAADAMTEGGTLTVRVRRSHEWSNSQRLGVQIMVADTGHGIEAANLPRLFEPFFSTKGEVGTGLGLWLSKSIVERHGGRMKVKSRVEPGRSGTVFSVFIPAQGAESEEAAQPRYA